MRSKRGCSGWPWMALAFIADRITKAAVAGLESPRTLIPGVLRLKPVRNTGVAFSMLSGTGAPVAVGTALVLAALTVYLLKKPDEPTLVRTGLWLIVGGGLGNLADRLIHGAVLDFIEPIFVRFAIFNVADVCVCVGAALAALGLLMAETRKKERDDG